MRYFAAAALVRLADEGARVALVLLAVERTGSASAGALLVAALLVPHVVAAPAVGLLADRARRPERLLAAAAAGFAAALGAAAIVGSTGLAALVLLAGGTCGPALTGGLTSLLPGLVTRERVPRAFGLDSLTYNVAGIGGPAVAALIAQAASARGAVLALAAAAATGALLLAGLPGTTRAAAPGRWDAGVRHVARDPVLATVTAASSFGQLGQGGLPVVAAVLAAQLGRPAAGGWLIAAVAAGGLLGSLAWTRRPRPPAQAPWVVMVALAGAGAPLALAAAFSSAWLMAPLFALCGASIGPLTGALFTARDDRAPQAVRAQVFTLGAGLKTTAAAAGAALAGALSALPGAAQLLVVAAFPILAGALGAARLQATSALRTRPAPAAARSSSATFPPCR